jgi:hypothetical protein
MGDDCHKRISQPRFVSWNDNNTQFFNHDAKAYHLLPAEKTYCTVNLNARNTSVGAVPDNAFQWCMEHHNKSYSFSEGARHDYIVHLVRYCNIKGLSEDETLKGCLQFIEQDFPEAEIKNIVQHIYTKQVDSHAKLPFTGKAIGFDHREVHRQRPEHQQQVSAQPQRMEFAQLQDLNPSEPRCDFMGSDTPNPENWEQNLRALEHYFETAKLPTSPIRLNPYSTISNVPLFIHSHLTTLKTNKDRRAFLPYFERLQELKTILTLNTN